MMLLSRGRYIGSPRVIVTQFERPTAVRSGAAPRLSIRATLPSERQLLPLAVVQLNSMRQTLLGQKESLAAGRL